MPHVLALATLIHIRIVDETVKMDFNHVELIFLNMAFMVSIFGFLINHFEKYVPKFVVQSYKYGSFAYKGSKLDSVTRMEIPKSYFKHFYVFAASYSVAALLYMLSVYSSESNASLLMLNLLDLGYTENRKSSVCAAAALCALTLVTLQCLRRLYETFCLQVFASNGKIHLSHYFVGYIHYFGTITTILAQAPGFSVPIENIVWSDTYTLIVITPCTLSFLMAWYEQYQSNCIFTNLRRDRISGKVITELHKIPSGRWFNVVSSPHRLTEIMMYAALFVLTPTRTMFCIFFWVLSNQVATAIQAHDWYLETFKNYPRTRTAIFPNIL